MNKLELENARRTMISYLLMKMAEEDWHGVQDAASDLREIDAKLSMIKETI